MHPADDAPEHFDLTGCRALVVCTNHGVLDIAKPTGVVANDFLVATLYARQNGSTATAIASSKLLLAAVNDSVVHLP